MVEFKRAVMPLQEPLHRLLDQSDLPAELRPYFVDVRGRLARAVERVAGFDDLLNSILQARLAQVSVDQNNDMRKIASWAAIAAVQTAIAGIYGMNFEHMPELALGVRLSSRWSWSSDGGRGRDLCTGDSRKAAGCKHAVRSVTARHDHRRYRCCRL